jgi:hypothetical protein
MDKALLEALNPEHERWRRQNFRSARTIDIVCRKDGREYRYEGDFLKDIARALVPTTPEEIEFVRIAKMGDGVVHLGAARTQKEG